MSAPIRTAILGFGRNGSAMHAGAIAANPEFNLTAVCDIDPLRRSDATTRFGCAVYDNHQKMLANEHLDLVAIVTRSDQHAAMACDCLSAGVDTLVTKPWAVEAGEARRMIAIAASSGRRLLPWLPARWGSDLRRLREIIGSGAIGRVFLIRRAVCSFATRCDWQTERRYGGGYLLNWGPHIVDTAIQLAGSRPVSVYARWRQAINPGDAEDLFLALLTLLDGTVVQAEYSIAAEPLPSWFIQGDRGTIVVNDTTIRVHRVNPAMPPDPTRFISMQSAEQCVTEETVAGSIYGDEHEVYRDIAAALRGTAAYPVTTADALGLTGVLDAIRIAATENRVVTLEGDIPRCCTTPS